MKEYFSIIIAFLSLIISLLTTYYTTLRPGKVEGSMNHLIFWQFSMMKDGRVTDRAFTPYFWLKNVGVQPVVIEDIRLIFTGKGGSFYAYPVNLVPRSIFNHDGEGKKASDVRTGAPVTGFALEKSELFTSNFNFHIDENRLSEIRGIMKMKVEILSGGQWVPVGTAQEYDFGESPDIDAKKIFKNLKGIFKNQKEASVPEGKESSHQIFQYPVSWEKRRQ